VGFFECVENPRKVYKPLFFKSFMAKEVRFICLALVIVLSLSLVSAGWFSDFWGKITGKAVKTEALPTGEPGEEDECEKDEECQAMYGIKDYVCRYDPSRGISRCMCKDHLTFCLDNGIECGTTRDSCGDKVVCGGCPAGKTCSDGKCVSSEEPSGPGSDTSSDGTATKFFVGKKCESDLDCVEWFWDATAKQMKTGFFGRCVGGRCRKLSRLELEEICVGILDIDCSNYQNLYYRYDREISGDIYMFPQGCMRIQPECKHGRGLNGFRSWEGSVDSETYQWCTNFYEDSMDDPGSFVCHNVSGYCANVISSCFDVPLDLCEEIPGCHLRKRSDFDYVCFGVWDECVNSPSCTRAGMGSKVQCSE